MLMGSHDPGRSSLALAILMLQARNGSSNGKPLAMMNTSNIHPQLQLKIQSRQVLLALFCFYCGTQFELELGKQPRLFLNSPSSCLCSPVRQLLLSWPFLKPPVSGLHRLFTFNLHWMKPQASKQGFLLCKNSTSETPRDAFMLSS